MGSFDLTDPLVLRRIAPLDVVRDVAAESGVGLLRMARGRDKLEDLFHPAGAA